jgi:hypothetical protein
VFSVASLVFFNQTDQDIKPICMGRKSFKGSGSQQRISACYGNQFRDLRFEFLGWAILFERLTHLLAGRMPF